MAMRALGSGRCAAASASGRTPAAPAPRAPTPALRCISTAAAPAGAPSYLDPATEDALKGPARVFAASLRTILARYWAASPTAARVVEGMYAAPGGFGAAQVAHDHLAFRTFGVPGLGIDGFGAALEAFGYTRRDDSVFEKKKLTATWYAPPPLAPGGPPAYELLPRIFVSQLEVSKLSPGAQAIIGRYTSAAGALGPAASWAAALTGERPWGTPAKDDYAALLAESEYAAWVLANGYALNHTALSVHRLSPELPGGLEAFNSRLLAGGFALNDEGGLIKASPDGLLLQSSTVADVGEVALADAGGRQVPVRVAQAYLEFVERRPLPGLEGTPHGALSEAQRRDGFEASSADNIFASTTLAATRGR